MSRGPGRLQRLILKRLRETPNGRLSRQALEEIFLDWAVCTSSNLLRALRGLERMNCVSLYDVPDLDKAYVSLPRPAKPVSDEFLAGLLAQVGESS
jgi:hypothetical protein